jgi:hypothetical protein
MDAIGYPRTFSGKPDLSAPKTSRAARSHRSIVPLSRVLSKTSRSTQPLTSIQCGLLRRSNLTSFCHVREGIEPDNHSTYEYD